MGECEARYAERQATRVLNGAHSLGLDDLNIRPHQVVYMLHGHRPTLDEMNEAFEKLKKGRQEIIEAIQKAGKDPAILKSGYSSVSFDWHGKMGGGPMGGMHHNH